MLGARVLRSEQLGNAVSESGNPNAVYGVGKQEMVGAIDAVCNVAERIIGKLKEGGAAGGPPLLGATVGNGHGTFPPRLR